MRVVKTLMMLISLTFIGVSNSYAHDANTAMIDLKKVAPHEYILHLRTPLFHLDEAVRSEMPSGAALVFNSDSYKKAVAAYIKNNLSLTARLYDGEGTPAKDAIAIESTALKLGNHETNIVLHLEGMKESEIVSLDIVAMLMTQNPNQKNIIRYVDGNASKSVFLNSDNHFSGAIPSFD